MRQLEPLLINKSDFDCIGQVAKHCDWNQLCIYIREQQNLSLLPKIGHCLFDLLMRYCEGWCIDGKSKDGYEPSDVLEHLWVGGYYTACDGSRKIHLGIKRSLVEWSYGAYVYRHGYVDTPFGVVQKLNQDSVPAPINELRAMNTEHRNNAEAYWKMTKEYLCSVKDISPISDCKICDCMSDCRCGHCSGNGKTIQNRGVKFKTISRS